MKGIIPKIEESIPLQCTIIWKCYELLRRDETREYMKQRAVFTSATTIVAGLLVVGSQGGLSLVVSSVILGIHAVLSYLAVQVRMVARPCVTQFYEEAINRIIGAVVIKAEHLPGGGTSLKRLLEWKTPTTPREIAFIWLSIPLYLSVVSLGLGLVFVLTQSPPLTDLPGREWQWPAIVIAIPLLVLGLYRFFRSIAAFEPTPEEKTIIHRARSRPTRYSVIPASLEYDNIVEEVSNWEKGTVQSGLLGLIVSSAFLMAGMATKTWIPLFLVVPFSGFMGVLVLYDEGDLRIWRSYRNHAEISIHSRLAATILPEAADGTQHLQNSATSLRKLVCVSCETALLGCSAAAIVVMADLVAYDWVLMSLGYAYLILCTALLVAMAHGVALISRTPLPPYEPVHFQQPKTKKH